MLVVVVVVVVGCHLAGPIAGGPHDFCGNAALYLDFIWEHSD